MDAILLARIQFAFTAGFHFIFPPISIGLAWMVFWFMTKYKTTKDETYLTASQFWTKILTITFAVGVATGITLEFQFGTNWAEYSRFVGDIFGAPLAAEGIFSFFLESVFIAFLIFGWKKFSFNTLWFSSLMVAVGSTLSAFWIIVANSWMQTPTGYHMVNGRAELTSFFEAVFNPSTLPRYLHTIDASIMTGAFFVMGIAGWYLLKGIHIEFAKKSFKAALIAGFIASVVQLGLGHYHAIQVTNTQPEKLATIEGLEKTQTNAPALLFGIPDDSTRTIKYKIEAKGLLSLLTSGKFDTEVKGMDAFAKEEMPPLSLTFYPFHVMVALGMFFIGMTGLGILLMMTKRLYGSKIFMALSILALPLPTIANELGWMTAEVGRQPWAIYHVVKTSNSISVNVPAEQLLFSIIMFGVVYFILFAAWVYLIKNKVAEGPKGVSI